VSAERLLAVLWERRWLFLATLALSLVLVVAVTLSLGKRYDATATLFVGERATADNALALDTSVGEQLSRTYTTLAAQPSVADAVRVKLASRPTRDELLSRMTFAPVERTQLLQITARESSPAAAANLANLYANTFVSRVSSSFERSATPTRITISEPAVAPTEAAVPNVPLYLGFGAVLALLLAAGAALLRDRLDDRLRIAPDDFDVLGHPVVARIPAFDPQARGGFAVTDAFRLLRANIDFSTDVAPRVIGVTSSTPLDGKSTIAAQLAVAAAEDGEAVVLVEADLRRPGLRETAIGKSLAPADTGLTNYLAGAAGFDALLVEHPEHPGLSVLWPGPLPPNPTRMLSSDRLGTLLAELREHFDRVIVDTSPISVGADASVVLSRVDGVLFVIDAQRTSRSRARVGLAQLDTSRAPTLGVVINRDRKPDRDYGYYASKPPGEAQPLESVPPPRQR
jgi:succinoglycan biosynthesis transport protein ExoP